MEKFTLFELHLDEATFTANANAEGSLLGDEGDGEEERTGDEATAATGEAGSGGGKLVVALVLLLLLVAVARALSGDDELDDLADLDATE